MKKFLLLIFVFSTIFVNYCFADSFDDNLWDKQEEQETAFMDSAGLSIENSVPSIAASVIKVFLSLLGIIFVGLIIYAGYNWMIAGGDEQKVTIAKQTLQRAIIGLIIIVSAYSISYFIFNAMDGAGGGGAYGTYP